MAANSNSPQEPSKAAISPAAYTLYLLGATAFLFWGAMAIADGSHHVLNIAFGAILVLVGGAFGLMAGRSRAGDVRFQRALVALSMVVLLFALGMTLFLGLSVLILITALLPMIGSFLVFRANSDTWFPQQSKPK